MAFVIHKPAQLKGKKETKNVYVNKKESKSAGENSEKTFENLIYKFGNKSTIHCMNRILQEKAYSYERWFWLLTFAIALLGCTLVCIVVSQRFKAGNVQTVVHTTNKLIFEITFPEIVICNKNHLNWQRLEEAKQHFLPQENNTERLRLFEQVIGLFDTLEFGEFEVFNALKGQRLELVKNINFSLVFDFMTWRCEEFLTECVWRYRSLNCCEIFSKSKSLNGFCWNFNTISTPEGRQLQLKDDKYPWRTGTAGYKSGLSVRVLINEDKHYRQDNEKGLLVSIMEQHVFSKTPHNVNANTHSLIVVDPIVYFYDNNTRSLSSSDRECLFNDESNSNDFKNLANFIYMNENCETQCRQEHLVDYCNCTLDFFFPPAGYRSCTVEDFLCLANNSNNLDFIEQKGEIKYVHREYRGMVCKCFRNCYSLHYVPDVKSMYLPMYQPKNKTHVELHVFFRFPKMMVYRTSLIFGWMDLLVSFGGIAGLFLGCSLISVIELFYFALIELPIFTSIRLKSERQVNSLQNHNFNDSYTKRIAPRKPCSWGINKPIQIAQNLQRGQALDFLLLLSAYYYNNDAYSRAKLINYKLKHKFKGKI